MRGGPALYLPGSKNVHLGIFTNPQKKLTFELNGGHSFSNKKGFRKSTNYNVSMGYRPIKSLKIDLSPGFSIYKDELQYVTQKTDNSDTRYIFAHINRKTLNMQVRINYNLTPDLSIQYWGQPFVASGKYTDFKYITDSKADDLNNRYKQYTWGNQIGWLNMTGNYAVDHNSDGNRDFIIDNPDFNVKEFLSNLVLRWEYQPGSTVYLVWSQTRSGYINNGSFDVSRDFESLFDENARNIFLVKFSYRLGR